MPGDIIPSPISNAGLFASNLERRMISQTSDTYWVRICLAGPIEVAKQIIREECLREGLCVTIEPTTYIYTGGEEEGYIVNLINYPRFPKEDHEILDRAINLGKVLRDRTFQHSVLVLAPDTTYWFTNRTSS